MKRRLYICLCLLGSLATGCASRSDGNAELLHCLDRAVDERREWDEAKERRIGVLRERLSSADGDSRIVILLDLCDEYFYYRVDSARHYAVLLETAAKRCGDRALLDRARLRTALFYNGLGRSDDSYGELDKIDAERLSARDAGAYVALKSSLLGKFVKSAGNKSLRDSCEAAMNAFNRQRTRFFDPSSAEYMWYGALDLEREGKRDTAFRLIMRAYDTAEDSHSRAKIASAAFNMAEGDMRERMLILSAIDDFRASVKEYTSLPKLAEILFERGDVERANRYMRCTMEDVLFCNHNSRMVQYAGSNEAISAAFSEALTSRRRIMIAMIIVVSLFAAAIMWALRWALRQKRKIERMNADLISVNEVIRGRNAELLELNERLKEVNVRLTDANRIKEQYVCHYMDLCSSYIAKLDDYRRSLNKTANASGADAVLKELRTPRLAEKEWREFYKIFDATFLDIFPNFIERVNELLVADERFVQKSAGVLNTELRILAVIRLGITDSVKIAYFLNCSLSTIYNYRTKMRNAAAGNRDDFETRVQSISVE
ncbi:MAG: hypothetical protein J6K28_07025 [Alistipes sp.]|nr:hypothetical protein [Alistipes sp.]